MAPRKTAAKPTTKTTAKAKTADAAPAPGTAPAEAAPAPQPAKAKAAPGHGEQAAQLAADARTLATTTLQAIAALNTRAADLAEAAAVEHPGAADAARRLPSTASDLTQALKAYAGAAAGLAAAAQR